MVKDTVFNEFSHPVFSNEPAEVLRRLKHGHPDNWQTVLIGKTKQVVTISEYLYGETFDMVVKTLDELIKKKDSAVFTRDPDRWRVHVERTAHRLISRIQDSQT